MISTKSNWNIENSFFEKLINEFNVDPKKPLRACGCGVKIDLDQIVYPALEEIAQKNNSIFKNQINKRRDSFSYRGKFKSLHRICSKNLDEFEKKLVQATENIAFNAVIELFSSGFNYYRNFEKLKDDFTEKQHTKSLIWEKIRDSKKIDFSNIYFAKGHSIQGETNFILNDLISFEDDPNLLTLVNNDTIITGDSVLEPHSVISVFISINNALNDLFIHGANQNIKIFPVYDGFTEHVLGFKKAFKLYQDYYLEKGVVIEIIDEGPLEIGAHLIGATVIAESLSQQPQYDQIPVGHKILITDSLGDLAILSINRKNYIDNSIDSEISNTRKNILQKLMRSHFDMAEIIQKYLPRLNEKFNDNKHVSFVSDISGPGLSVLEEAAQESNVSIYVEDIKIINDEILNHPRKNYTTSTNGPWIISGKLELLESIKNDLKNIGIQSYFQLGETIPGDQSGNILVSAKLYHNYHGTFKFDLFNPSVRVQFGNEERNIICPLFKKIKVQNEN